MRYGEMVRRAAGNPDDDPDNDCIEQLDSDKKPAENGFVSYSTPITVTF